MRRLKKQDKITRALACVAGITGKQIPAESIVSLLEALIEPEDTVLIEGDNQKQATFLAGALNRVNPMKVHGLHMIMPSLQLPEHLSLFRKGIGATLDFCYAGSQSKEIVNTIRSGCLEVRSLQTYLELYGRLFSDLIPDICLVAAEQADAAGNLYTGPNTEETPVLVESAAFKDGIVIAQVNELVNNVKRVDVSGDMVDFIVRADEPYLINPIFTRDPAAITDVQILMAMVAIKGIYARHSVKRLNHGIGFNTAAIELLLPTYGEELGLKGKICTNWVLNPHPTLIPAIESGWVKSVMPFGGELGMEDYVANHPDIFTVGSDGSLRSNRALAQIAGQYGTDLFIGSTLQMDACGNSSTVTRGRLSGFGGAPNMGSNPNGRRYANECWNSTRTSLSGSRGHKCVVQMLQTVGSHGPNFVEQLDAVEMGRKIGLAEPPIMVYGEDVTHVITEFGIGYLYQAETPAERRQIIAAVARNTPVADGVSRDRILALRKSGKVACPEDLGIDESRATRKMLAAQSLEDLVAWSKGLYHIPTSCKRKT